jgi:hypothetical protein
MRTKALLLTAALGLAGAATSMAQAVYSVNVVGYINLTMKPGFNLVANQLNASPNNTLASVLGVVPDETQVLKFGNNNYTSDIYFTDLGGWVDPNSGAASTTVVNPGDGFFYFNPAASDRVATLVGEVRTGTGLNVTHPPGFSLVSSIVPQQVALTPVNGFTPVEEMQYLTFNAGSQTYNEGSIYFADLGGWVNGNTGAASVPTPAVGDGYFIFNPGAVNHIWSRSFNPNN